ncbi:AraC family transcriptional regulator [Lutimonas sp.]|uniref:AraC family transcriptional regulator n=1 Tax=Lutimonas sp. TaxID=1872403 RepID=UPI003D9AC3E4
MKKILLLIAIFLGCFLSWYFLLKPYDYLVSLEPKTFPGAVNQSIKTWNLTLDNSSLSKSDDLLALNQLITYGDSVFLYEWRLEAINDSTTFVKVYVTDQSHSFQNRLNNLFFYTDFEKRVKNSLTEFNSNLKQHISRFKVKIVGEDHINKTYCAFIRISGPQGEKAVGMMQNFSLLTSTLVEKNIELDGRPFIEVIDWDMTNDYITYDFCYPIKNKEDRFDHSLIHFREVTPRKALKAIYNGNYITSDRAWYALVDYAAAQNITIDKKPFEVFHNNPNMGGDELQWQAEIFMPIKE